MREWKDVKIHPSASILEAIQIIDASALQIGLVIDDTNQLMGTVTDGDIRRAILNGINMKEQVTIIMNCNPKIIHIFDNQNKALEIMKKSRLKHLPVIDNENKIFGITILDDLLEKPKYDNWVVLMAGGLGSRLGSLTEKCPKPLIPVGGKPLLETIVENFKEQGFYKFFFSVNYKADMIEKYFGNGEKWGIDIVYLKEQEKLGTAGALKLLPENPDKPIIVMNGDLLTKVNFQQLLDYHGHHKAYATMCVREYSFQVPYGVVCMENGKLECIDEKPVHNFFVSAGIYVLEPDTLEYIPSLQYYDMPNLFKEIIKNNNTANVFPIHEYWLDIGKHDDLVRANSEYRQVFGE